MKLVLLSLLLLGLVALAILVGVRESFDDAAAKSSGSASSGSSSPMHVDLAVSVSPTLKNLLAGPNAGMAPQVDTLARNQDILNASMNQQYVQAPSCQQQYPSMQQYPSPQQSQGCPDMSNYVRMDQVPCWNCSLP
jgi:hypothetical protein